MHVLLDTNFLISAEPTDFDEVEPNTETAQSVLRCISALHWQASVHPAIEHDLYRDPNSNRAELRRLKFTRFDRLEVPFPIDPALRAELAQVDEGSNDWVDWNLIAAVRSDVVSYLISDDARVHSRARRLGLGSRVLRAAEALYHFESLLGEAHVPRLPAVEAVGCHLLDPADPIFDTLRQDYSGFDDWLGKCKRERRDAYRIVDGSDGRMAAVAILNCEAGAVYGLPAGSLKICTFKVSPEYSGRRFGELLLKAVFQYAEVRGFTTAFVTAYESQEFLAYFLDDFGFEDVARDSSSNELVLAKRFGYREEIPGLTPFEVHRRFGPSVVDVEKARTFVVPIKPDWFSLLFPDCDEQHQLLAGAHPCGNAISKAYLCHSGTSTVRKGDNLLFYRSGGKQQVRVLGVVEAEPVRSGSAEELARFVSRGTVYTLAEIEGLAAHGEVLAIRFRQAIKLEPPLRLKTLKAEGVLTDYPQTLQQVRPGGMTWLMNTLKKQFYCPSDPNLPTRF